MCSSQALNISLYLPPSWTQWWWAYVCYAWHLQLHFRVSVCLIPPQVTYWDVFDGSVIRELEASLSGSINGMHISQDGKHFVTGNGPLLIRCLLRCCCCCAPPFSDFSIDVIQLEINESKSTKSLGYMRAQYHPRTRPSSWLSFLVNSVYITCALVKELH